MNKWEASRRDLLKGLGVGLGMLPMLQTRTYAQNIALPQKLAVVLLTEGYRPGMVAPGNGPLANQALPPVTQPLEKHKNDIIIMTNLNNPQFRGCARWAHGTYGTVFAQDRGDPNTGNGKEYWEPMNPTFDQVIAAHLQKANPGLTPSLALSVRVGTNSGGTGSNRCFWKGAKQPITPEADPYKLFDMIFMGRPNPAPGMAMADPAADKLRVQRKSILDFVGRSLDKFKGQLGTEDRKLIDGHFASIRNIEKELTATAGGAGGGGVSCTPMASGDLAKPVAIANNANNGFLLNAGFQLMTMALKCDYTRVATMQFGDATGGSVTFPVVNVGRDWHSLGHNPGGDKIVVDKWCMTMFSGFIDLLKATQDGANKTMHDSTTLLWANHMESGDTHQSVKLPWIMAGKGGGVWKTGMSYVGDGSKNNTHVMATICNAMGVPITTFGDGALWPELRA